MLIATDLLRSSHFKENVVRVRYSLRALLLALAATGLLAGVVRNYLMGIHDRAERHEQAVAIFDDQIFTRQDWKNAALDARWDVQFAKKWIHPSAYDTATFMHLNSNWRHVRENIHQLRHLSGLHDLRGEINSISLKEAEAILAIPNLNILILSIYEHAEPGALAQLASAPKLEQFWVGGQDTDTATFRAIGDSRTLKSVTIRGQHVSASDLEIVAKCQTIEKLLLDQVQITPETLAPLKKLPQLREMEFTNCEMSAASFHELARMPLIHLHIFGQNTPLRASFAPLARSTTLESLIVHAACPQAEGEISAFRKTKKLQRLILPTYQITPDELRTLGGNPSLDAATFAGDISEQDYRAFVDRKPGRGLSIKPISADQSASN